MRNVPETVHCYKISRLNWIFVVFSLLFVAAVVWMIWFDYIGYRSWKRYQREFQSLEAAKLRREYQQAQQKAEQAGLDDVLVRIRQEQERLDANQARWKAAVAEAEKKRVAFETRDTAFKFRKADLDAQKYSHDVAFTVLRDNPGSAEAARAYRAAKARLDAMKQEVAELEVETQRLELEYKQAQAKVDELVSEKNRLEREMRQLTARRDLIASRLDKLTNTTLQAILNAPFLEIAQPTIRVKQLVLEDHRIHVNFADVPRVDRCISCHNGIHRRDADGGGPSGKTPTPREIEAGDFRFADLPQPHRAHPRLDLFVGDTSPHPMEQFGCSVCHWGWDRGMDFTRAAHMPDEDRIVSVAAEGNGKGQRRTVEKSQEQFWREQYHWHEMHHAEQKMRPLSFTESSCLKCHTGQTTIPEAPRLDHGIRLIEQAGCYACHKMQQLETVLTHRVAEGEDLDAVARLLGSDPEAIRQANGLRTDEIKPGMELAVPVRALGKPGPSLLRLAGKLTPDWTRRWLAEPQRFRPNTFMPQFWGLAHTYVRLTNDSSVITYNGVSGRQFELRDREQVEIEAITEMLFAISEPAHYEPSPVPGDAERGKTLTASLGCYACHVVNERLEKDQTYNDGTPVDERAFPLLKIEHPVRGLSEAQYKRSRSQGPMLHGSGSKMDPGWLYAWLKDPKQYHPRTKMPKLRLTDQEAADVAAFLATLRSEDFDLRPLPDMNQELYRRVRDDLVQEYLESDHPRFEAAEMVREGRLQGKTAEFLRRVKYAPVLTLLDRWGDLLTPVKKLPRELGEAERMATKRRWERLASDMRTLAAAEPSAGRLLTTWAGELGPLLEKVLAWNNLSEDERKGCLAQAEGALQAARRQFEEFTLAEANQLDLEKQKKLFLGAKLVERYGCYSCHEIRGFENAKPIGTELTEWGSKETAQLDFGYLEGKIDHSNYAYVQQKIKAPRSFDKTDVKKPQEWYKMPQYNFTAEQRKAIAIAIMGMTNEKVLPQARRQLSETEKQIEQGRWLVKELNCVGCHVVEKRGGALLATLDPNQKQLWPPDLAGTGLKLKPTWLYHFLHNPGQHVYRYWVPSRMPTFGFSDNEVNILTRYFALLDKQAYPFEEGTLQTSYLPPAETVAVGEQIYEKFQCYKCHNVRPAEQAARASNIGPNMALVKERMRPRGIIAWLKNPLAITPGVNMPANWPTTPDDPNPLPNILGGDTEKQIQAVADYLLTYDGSIEARYPVPKEEPAAAGESEYE